MAQRKIIYIVIVVILAVLLLSAGYFLGVKRNLSLEKAKSPEETLSSDIGAGTIGEVMTKEAETGREALLVSPTLPPTIFSTAGTVKEVKSDRVIIGSNGTHFADGMPRDVTVFFTAETSTFVVSQSFKWKGFSGLDHLEVGMEIIVESRSNIRGRTEFQANNINIL